ncbi:MAG: hypothetical protein AMXMBFR82_26400 [Candidatus Hydrogenedentota bacterium]
MYLRTIVVCAVVFTGLVALGQEDDGGGGTAVEPVQLDKLTSTIAAALSGVDVEGWERSPVERYVVENLYDKINGRSELYMSYGVRGMVFATYTRTGHPTDFVDVFLYDMGSVAGGFGVYSVERWGDWEAAAWGREGYRTDTDAFFWKGAYYATVLGSSEAPEVREAQQRIAGGLANALPDSGESLWGLTVLPEKNLVPGSIQYFMVDAMSLSFMEDTFTAQYRYGEAEVTAFVAKREAEANARETRDAFVDYMKKYGDDAEELVDGETSLHVADMGGGYYDVVFAEGPYVGGVTFVAERALAIDAANTLRTELQKAE